MLPWRRQWAFLFLNAHKILAHLFLGIVFGFGRVVAFLQSIIVDFIGFVFINNGFKGSETLGVKHIDGETGSYGLLFSDICKTKS